VFSLDRGAALGLFGSGPANCVSPFSHFRPAGDSATLIALADTDDRSFGLRLLRAIRDLGA
jgi:hypothetical protein